jgi:predicted permease
MLPRSPLFADLRRLGRRPAFLALALVTLALGIGATTAMFAVVHAVLLRPLPYPQPDRLVTVWTHSDLPQRQSGNPLSRTEAVEIAARARAFSGFAAYGWGPATLLGGAEPQQVVAASVTQPFFDVLGVAPLLGRAFAVAEGTAGHDGVVVLSHGLWRQWFGGDRAVLGRKVVVDGRPRTVVGVMPPGFDPPGHAALWVPMPLDLATLGPDAIRSHGLNAVARLRPGATLAEATADLDRVTRELAAVYAGHFDADEGALLLTLQRTLLGGSRAPLLALLAAVGFLLLLACANVANLLLLRAEERGRELALRRALGASPGRLAALLLGEALALSAAAAVLAVLAAQASLAGVRALLPSDLPRATEVTVDWRVLLFALALATTTTLLAAAAPIWRARRAGASVLLRGAGSTSRGRLADALVVGQIALALALCAGAALAARSLQRLAVVDPGFATDHALIARLSLPEGGRYGSEGAVQGFYRELAERLAADPRVVAVGAASWLPFADTPSDWPVEVEGLAPPETPEGAPRNPDYTLVSGDYLRAIAAPLLAGRLLRSGDEVGLRKAVVTRSFVARHQGGGEAIGRRLRLALDPTPYEIVGVVADQRLRGPAVPARGGIFLPQAEIDCGQPFLPRSMAVVVRTSGPPTALAGTLRRLVRELDPELPIAELRTFADVRRAALGEPRSLVGLLGVFASLGLVLGGVGSFTVAAAWVAQRRRDIGVRLAIGARPRRVVREVVQRSLGLTALGCVLGGLVAWRAAQAVGDRLLFETGPGDPLALGGAALLLLVVGALATAVPARRASRVDPLRALREE